MHADASECPLCGSAEKIVGLVGVVEAKLQSLAALRAAVSEKDARLLSASNAQSALAQTQGELEEGGGHFRINSRGPRMARRGRATSRAAPTKAGPAAS